MVVDIIAKVIIGIVGIACLYALRLWKKELVKKQEMDDYSALDAIILELVTAAEQMLKLGDPDGHKRKAYVTEGLAELGVTVTEIVNAKIEAAVYRLHHGGESE